MLKPTKHETDFDKTKIISYYHIIYKKIRNCWSTTTFLNWIMKRK